VHYPVADDVDPRSLIWSNALRCSTSALWDTGSCVLPRTPVIYPRLIAMTRIITQSNLATAAASPSGAKCA
jgi:hypothetical protein